ncbi:MAG: hypothetical protein AMJ81_07115 [Phycisphaerae bacterium SM23_33]|nr:MAG: hypothetical protein AMJ81_07115 [Phycisphaerae bacterium SM23_33]
MAATTFKDDVDFLSGHTDLVVLDAKKPALVGVAPAWQGRVMTSTPGGEGGPSLGWINRKFIAAGPRGTAFDNYGGEDRFWLGPEGGQFALWFRKGEPFDTAHWRTPEGLNTGRFDVTSQGPGSIALAAHFDVTNYAGTTFQVAVKRIIDVLGPDQLARELGLNVPAGVSWVGFESVNTLANVGKRPWTRDGGLLSVWTLGQLNPLPRGMVIVPFIPGREADLGPLPNGEYFGPIGPDRFSVRDDYVLFRCDGRFRSKLGVSPARARSVLGSFDPDARILTVVQFNLPAAAGRLPYVNSLWEIQDEPLAGDAVNSYNDGEETPGAGQFGPFYEIETSSPAAELAPHEAVTHVHRTFHFTGQLETLNELSQRVLGVDLGEITFPR